MTDLVPGVGSYRQGMLWPFLNILVYVSILLVSLDCDTAGKSCAFCKSTGADKESVFRYMGYSIRTLEFRYTEWLLWDAENATGLWDEPIAFELYSHKGDTGEQGFDVFDYKNVYDKYPEIGRAMGALLRKVFIKGKTK